VTTNIFTAADSILTTQTGAGDARSHEEHHSTHRNFIRLHSLWPSGDPLPEMWEVIYGTSVNAVKIKRLEQLKQLIKQGADVNAPIGLTGCSKKGEDASSSSRIPTAWPLDVAVQQAQVDMVKLLPGQRGEVSRRRAGQGRFRRKPGRIARHGHGLDPGGSRCQLTPPDYRHTALFWASFKGYKDSVKLLLSQPGIKLDAIDIDGGTALMAAAENGHAEIAEMLLKAGANVSITDKRGETATSLAQKTLAKQQAIVVKQQAMLSKLQSHSK
jgi:hypothetical protein